MTQIEQVADRLAAYVNGFVENPESLIVDLSDLWAWTTIIACILGIHYLTMLPINHYLRGEVSSEKIRFVLPVLGWLYLLNGYTRK